MVHLKFKVRVFLGDQLIEEDEVQNLVIHCPVVDRIVKTTAERCQLAANDE